MLKVALVVTLCWPQVVLLARAIGWEAPQWAIQDRDEVAAAIRIRMFETGWSLEEVLYEPNQFSVAYLLDQDPPDVEEIYQLAAETLACEDESCLAARVTHFWSPVCLSEPPSWADPRCHVETDTVHEFYNMPGRRCP